MGYQPPPWSPVGNPGAFGHTASQPKSPQATIFAEGDTVVLLRGSPLPPYCLKCGQPAAGTIKKTLHWHPGWIYLTLLLSPLIYVFVASAYRKSETVAAPLCGVHLSKRRSAVLATWGVIGFSGLVLAIALANPRLGGDGTLAAALMLASFFCLFFVAPIVWSYGTRLLEPVSIDDQVMRVRGAGAGFLRGLAPMPWPR